jgi:hypothetical protein
MHALIAAAQCLLIVHENWDHLSSAAHACVEMRPSPCCPSRPTATASAVPPLPMTQLTSASAVLEVARLRVGAAGVHLTDVQLRVNGCRQAGDPRSSCTGIARRIIASVPLTAVAASDGGAACLYSGQTQVPLASTSDYDSSCVPKHMFGMLAALTAQWPLSSFCYDNNGSSAPISWISATVCASSSSRWCDR